MYTLRFDGLYREISIEHATEARAGLMCYGWLVSKHGKVIAMGHGALARSENATSNAAEYIALIEGLEAMIDMGLRGEKIRILGDAKTIINQMQGISEVNSEHSRPLFRKARHLANLFSDLTWNWTPRQQNRDADQLTRRALRQARYNEQRYDAAVNTLLKPKRNKNGDSVTLVDLRIFRPAGIEFGRSGAY